MNYVVIFMEYMMNKQDVFHLIFNLFEDNIMLAFLLKSFVMKLLL